MKNIVSFLVIALLSGLFACSPGAKGPEKVAKDFMKSVYTADFVKAKSLCTEESKQTIDLIATLTSDKTDKMKQSKVDYEIQNVIFSEDGNSATVTGLLKNSLDLQKGEIVDSKEEQLKLVKVNDQWLVEYKIK